jgi:hypothetical protein
MFILFSSNQQLAIQQLAEKSSSRDRDGLGAMCIFRLIVRLTTGSGA